MTNVITSILMLYDGAKNGLYNDQLEMAFFT